ncbi:hypothetical protein LCGC14_1144630 [marine sediment metagenome]|uniref:Uncharacterized protein n=1 Tax=marine sediment metagenome TaxID=412755 RepID=A0A0F9M208_9ZZZZ
MMQMTSTPTNYQSLPNVPGINAMPQGVPRGPWSNLYRTAPGSSLPSQMMLYGGAGGLGRAPAVQIVGGLGEASTGKKTAILLMNTVFAAIIGTVVAMGVGSSNPVRNTAIGMGGVAFVTGLYFWAATSNGAEA